MWGCAWREMRASGSPYTFIREEFKYHPEERLKTRDFIRGK